MNAARRTLALLATAACGLAGARAQQAYFPPGWSPPADAAGWHALAQAEPLRVRATPATAEVDGAAPAARLELAPEIAYVRVRRIERDLAAVEAALGAGRLAIDLRYVHGDIEAAIHLGGLLARAPLTLPAATPGDSGAIRIQSASTRAPGQTTLVLVNRATRGPLEAVLAALQQAGEVLLVGTSTAGDTGHFSPVPGHPDFEVITGEYVPTAGVSLLARGARPALEIEVDPAADEAAYRALDSGTAPDDLLDPPVNKLRVDEATLLRHHAGDTSRESQRTASSRATSSEASETPPPADRILQRAVNTLIAHDALRPRATL